MESFLLASIHTLYFVEQPASFLPTQKNTLKRSVKKWTNNTKSGPCLEISCATIFQPRIPAHLLRCILHTAYTLFPGTDLKLLNTTRHLIYESYITCVFVFSLFMYLYYISIYIYIHTYINIYMYIYRYLLWVFLGHRLRGGKRSCQGFCTCGLNSALPISDQPPGLGSVGCCEKRGLDLLICHVRYLR